MTNLVIAYAILLIHTIRTLLLFFLLFHHYTVCRNKVWIVGHRPLWSIVFINTFSFQDFFLYWIVSIVSCILDFSWILNAFEFTLFHGIFQTTFEDTLKFFDSFLIFFCFKLIKLFFFFSVFWFLFVFSSIHFYSKSHWKQKKTKCIN